MVQSIAIGCDHGGFDRKEELVKYLKERGYTVTDFGCHDRSSMDYTDVAIPLAKAVAEGRFDRGILVCTTGIGMSMMANRFDFIRGALVQNTDMAKMCRSHNDANVLIFGAKYTDEKTAQECVEIFLNTPFEGGRHARRVNKLSCSGGQK